MVLAQMTQFLNLYTLNLLIVNMVIIIDSSRTNELSEVSTCEMMKFFKRDFSEHQIILALIYKIDILNPNIINLKQINELIIKYL